MLDLEQVPARGAAVDHLEEAVLPGAPVDALEPGVVSHRAVPASINPGPQGAIRAARTTVAVAPARMRTTMTTLSVVSPSRTVVRAPSTVPNREPTMST